MHTAASLDTVHMNIGLLAVLLIRTTVDYYYGWGVLYQTGFSRSKNEGKKEEGQK
jgi:hypothetical protein